jgi:nucleotide-binding universal stress UspA family protein
MTDTPPDLLFHNPLVAFDGSRDAELALAAAILTVQRSHARLTILTVAADATKTPGAVALDPQIQDQVDDSAHRHMRTAVARIPEDIPVTKLFKRGRPGPAIVAAAQEGDHDLILVGARGVGRVGGLIGSVSQYVLHHARTTVFVAHAPRDS